MLFGVNCRLIVLNASMAYMVRLEYVSEGEE